MQIVNGMAVFSNARERELMEIDFGPLVSLDWPALRKQMVDALPALRQKYGTDICRVVEIYEITIAEADEQYAGFQRMH